jgi:hypothetical protein
MAVIPRCDMTGNPLFSWVRRVDRQGFRLIEMGVQSIQFLYLTICTNRLNE